MTKHVRQWRRHRAKEIFMYYKVLRRNPRAKNYISLMVAGFAKLEYNINKWTSSHPEYLRHGYGVCVFESLDYAIKYANELEGIIYVAEAECANCLDLPAFALSVTVTCYGSSIIETVKQDVKFSYMRQAWPYSTLMFEKIKPVRIVPASRAKNTYKVPA